MKTRDLYILGVLGTALAALFSVPGMASSHKYRYQVLDFPGAALDIAAGPNDNTSPAIVGTYSLNATSSDFSGFHGVRYVGSSAKTVDFPGQSGHFSRVSTRPINWWDSIKMRPEIFTALKTLPDSSRPLMSLAPPELAP